MKKLLTLAIAMAPSLFFAQITAPEPAVAQEVEAVEVALTTIELNKTTHDFGTINEGDVVKTIFTVTNTGSEPLQLNRPKVSCGCTTPSYPKELVQPGESADIEVQFNSRNKPNKQFKRVTLTGNFEQSPLAVTFTALVKPAAETAAVIAEKEKLQAQKESAVMARKVAEEKAAEKAVKENKIAEKATKQVDKAQNKTEKEIKKAESLTKKIAKQAAKVSSLESKITKGATALKAAQLKFDAKKEAGKLSPVDITKWEKKQRMRELAVEKLKAKLAKESTKLSRLK